MIEFIPRTRLLLAIVFGTLVLLAGFYLVSMPLERATYNLLVLATLFISLGLFVFIMPLTLKSKPSSGPPNKGFNRTPVSSGPAKPGEFGGGAG